MSTTYLATAIEQAFAADAQTVHPGALDEAVTDGFAELAAHSLERIAIPTAELADWDRRFTAAAQRIDAAGHRPGRPLRGAGTAPVEAGAGYPAGFMRLQHKLTMVDAWGEEEETAQNLLRDFAIRQAGPQLPASLRFLFDYVGRSSVNDAKARPRYKGVAMFGGGLQADGRPTRNWCTAATTKGVLEALRLLGYTPENTNAFLNPGRRRHDGHPLKLYGPDAYGAPLQPGDMVMYLYDACQYGGHTVTVVEDLGDSFTHISGNTGDAIALAIGEARRLRTAPAGFDLTRANRSASDAERQASNAYIRTLSFGANTKLVYSVVRFSIVFAELTRIAALPAAEQQAVLRSLRLRRLTPAAAGTRTQGVYLQTAIEAATAMATGSPARAQQQADLAARIVAAYGGSPSNKGRVFSLLREIGRSGAITDPGAMPALTRIFAAGSEDLWLAERLVRHGAEPLWPAAEIDARARRGWAAEAGNIEARLPDPHPQAGGVVIPPVRAYFFPGRETNCRALIFGGVHGSEPQGAWAAQRLREELTAAGNRGRMPRFSTIVVPVLIERTHRGGVPPASATRYRGGARNLPGDAEPNRTFPLPGTSYSAARARRAAGQPELMARPTHPTGVTVPNSTPRPPSGDNSSTTMPPETRVLLTLLERFRPQRVASLHAHKLPGSPGDGPGIFVDPRGVDPATLAVTGPAARAQDIAFARELLAHARRIVPGNLPASAFNGNQPSTGREDVLYSSSAHADGNSFGMYAPVAARDASGTVVRDAATTVTIEIPRWTDEGQLDGIVETHRRTLQEVFLERLMP